MTGISEATKELAEIMKNYLKENSKRNKMSIHKASNVPYTTICRLMNLSSESFFETQVSILSAIAPEEIDPYIKKFHPSLYEAFSSSISQNPTFNGLSHFLGDRSKCEMISLLYSTDGISKGELFEIYGEKASEFISELENEELTEQFNNNIRLKNRSSYDIKFVGKMIESGISNLGEISKFTDTYTAAYESEGYSLTGINKNQKIIKEFWDKIEENRKNNPGNICYEFGVFFKPVNTKQARKIENEEAK